MTSCPDTGCTRVRASIEVGKSPSHVDLAGSGTNVNAADFIRALAGASLPRARARAKVFVVEEEAKKPKVASVHGEAELEVCWVDRAGPRALAVVDYCRVPRHVAAHRHLQDLDGGDERRKRRGEVVQLGRHEKVVGVHNGVHCEVHGSEPEPCRHAVVISVPTVQHHGHVVEPVQENDALLLQHEEHCVAQLRDFGKDKQPHPQPHGPIQVPLLWVFARGRREAVGVYEPHQVRQRACHTDDGKDRQQEVPQRKCRAQL